MDIFYRIKYYTRKAMLSVMGPAQLDSEHDPVDRLQRERDAKLGAKPVKATKQHVPKRHFAEGEKSKHRAEGEKSKHRAEGERGKHRAEGERSKHRAEGERTKKPSAAA